MEEEGIKQLILALMATATGCLSTRPNQTIHLVVDEYQYVGVPSLPVRGQSVDHIPIWLPCVDRENRPGIEQPTTLVP